MNTVKGLINIQCILSENRKTVDHFCIKCLLCCFILPTLYSINHDKKCIVVLDLAGNLIPSFVMSTYWSLLKSKRKVKVGFNDGVCIHRSGFVWKCIYYRWERVCGRAVNGVLSRWLWCKQSFLLCSCRFTRHVNRSKWFVKIWTILLLLLL